MGKKVKDRCFPSNKSHFLTIAKNSAVENDLTERVGDQSVKGPVDEDNLL